MWEMWLLEVIQVCLLAGILAVAVLRWLREAGFWAEVQQRRRVRRKRRAR